MKIIFSSPQFKVSVQNIKIDSSFIDESRSNLLALHTYKATGQMRHFNIALLQKR
jgi:hypothetical protein